jgi:hypothetical protein
MRKFILRVIGCGYVLISLLALTPSASGGLFVDSTSYNIFLGIMGLFALGAADLGGKAGKWFDLIFSLVLIVLAAVGAINFVNFGSAFLGNIFVDGLSAIALLYCGLILNHRLKRSET